MPRQRIIDLDGRTLEGGGQLVRLAVCLSALTGNPIRITNIRGNRPKNGGLKAQHLACVLWLARACNATIYGAEKGSQTLEFTPGTVHGDLAPVFKRERGKDGKGGDFYSSRFDIGTAGATSLGLQAVLPFIIFTSYPTPLPVRLTLTGGTNVSFSPSYDYIANVLVPMLHAIGLPRLVPSLCRRGWSTGDSRPGEWDLLIPARSSISLPGFMLQPLYRDIGAIPSPSAPEMLRAVIVGSTDFKTTVSDALPAALETAFRPIYGEYTNLEIDWSDSGDPRRMYILLIASGSLVSPSPAVSVGQKEVGSIATKEKKSEMRLYTLARDALVTYNPRKTPSPEALLVKIVQRVVRELIGEWCSGACVDEHMRDQLVVFAALAEGHSGLHPGREGDGEREPSLHTRTAEWVARQILGSGVRFEGEGGNCEGIGFGCSNVSHEGQGLREQVRKLERSEVTR